MPMTEALFIGGPRDGQTASANEDVLLAPIRGVIPVSVVSADEAKDMSYDCFVYHRVRTFPGNDFWVPAAHSSDPIPYIMDRLTACYRPPVERPR